MTKLLAISSMVCMFILWWFRSAFRKHSYEDGNPD